MSMQSFDSTVGVAFDAFLVEARVAFTALSESPAVALRLRFGFSGAG